MTETRWMPNPRFLVIGRAGIDFYPATLGGKINQSRNFDAMLGGSSGNIAAGLARHGLDVALFTALPDDPLGQLTQAELAVFGIDNRYVMAASSQSRTTLALAENTVDDHQALLYRHGAADLLITSEHLEQVDLRAFGTVVVTGTALSAEPSRSTTLEAMARAQEAGLCVVLDLDYRVAAWNSPKEAQAQFNQALPLCTILVGNDVEFGVLAEDGAGVDCAAAFGKSKVAIYKMGENGTEVFTPDAKWFTPIFPVTPLKPVGAGDAFLSSFLAALAANKSMKRAVIEGSASAAMVVTRPGCSAAMPTRDELNTFLTENES